MAEAADPEAGWSQYYTAVADRLPREILVSLVRRLKREAAAPGLAIDLGCGNGIETAMLIDQGWRVLALDGQAAAIDLVRARVAPENNTRLEARVQSFETLTSLPPADLIWAGNSLPFCPPAYYEAVWAAIVAALRPGGRFAGDFFGPRHAWAGEKDMSSHTADQVKALCQPLFLEFFREDEGEVLTPGDGLQHWHAFAVIARRP